MLCVLELDTRDKSEEARKMQAQFICDLTSLLVPLAAQNIKANKVPPLYKSGVKYHRQNPKACAYRWPSDVNKRRNGDCKQLVLWRAGELLNAGEPVTFRVMWLNHRDGFQAHILIRRKDGSWEDPSFILGMKGNG